MVKQLHPSPRLRDRPLSKRQRRKGRYKLLVWFIDNPRAPRTFWSNVSQDARQISETRLKGLVTGKWAGKVNWAGLFENGHMVQTYHRSYDAWRDPLPLDD